MPSAENLDAGGGRLPVLPGGLQQHPTPRRTFAKRQLLQWNKGVAVLREDRETSLEPPLFHGDLAALQSKALALQWGENARHRRPAPAFTPEWVLKESQILRFTGYMQQYLSLEKEVSPDTKLAVPPQRNASLALVGEDEYCVRSVVLRYFMLDNTIELLEPRVPNSGLQQGVLLSRQPVPHATHPDRCYHFTDLTLGSVLNLYGRKVTLADCDLCTRDILESEGVDVGEAVPVPSDPYLRQRAADTQSPIRDSRLMEELGCGPCTARPSTANPTGPLLNFSGMVEESGGTAAPCVVRYDPSTKLLEVRRTMKEPGTSGVVLRWCSATVQASPSPEEEAAGAEAGQTHEERPIRAEDLAPPATLQVYGRRLLISDCDQRTRAYLTSKSLAGKAAADDVQIATDSVEQHLESLLQETAERTAERPAPDAELPVKDTTFPRRTPRPIEVGTATGVSQPATFSAGLQHTDITGKRLVRSGLLPNDAQAVLRFSATLKSQLPLDKDRQFVLSFFPSDKTIELREIRRGGGLGGKVVARTHVAIPVVPGEHQRYYDLSDLAIGSAVTIYGRVYVVTGCDKRVLHLVQRAPEAVSSAFRESVKAHFGETDADKDNTES